MLSGKDPNTDESENSKPRPPELPPCYTPAVGSSGRRQQSADVPARPPLQAASLHAAGPAAPASSAFTPARCKEMGACLATCAWGPLRDANEWRAPGSEAGRATGGHNSNMGMRCMQQHMARATPQHIEQNFWRDMGPGFEGKAQRQAAAGAPRRPFGCRRAPLSAAAAASAATRRACGRRPVVGHRNSNGAHPRCKAPAEGCHSRAGVAATQRRERGGGARGGGVGRMQV
jgi:hypothetical protein